MDYQEAKPVKGKHLDFADYLIVHKAELVAALDEEKLEGFYSFDKAVAQLNGARVPEPP